MTITLTQPKTKTELNRMHKKALIDWATQACLLEATPDAEEMTKAQLVQEVLDMQMYNEVMAEQASGVSGEQVVVVDGGTLLADDEVRALADVDLDTIVWQDADEKKAALAARREAAPEDMPAWKRLRSGHACSLCGKDGTTGGKFGAPLCGRHYANWRALVKDETVEDDRAALLVLWGEQQAKAAEKAAAKTAKPKAKSSTSKSSKASTSKTQSKGTSKAKTASKAKTPKLTAKQKSDALYSR